MDEWTDVFDDMISPLVSIERRTGFTKYNQSSQSAELDQVGWLSLVWHELS